MSATGDSLESAAGVARQALRHVQHLILDRDGVLNRESPHGGYIVAPAQFHWLPGVLEALAQFRTLGLRVSVATNQSGVGRGIVSAATVDAIHRSMSFDCVDAQGSIASVFVCPHAPDAHCDCRKPAPGLIRRAIAASAIARERTVVVGDDERDLEAARAAGVRAVLLRTGKGQRFEGHAIQAGIPIYDDLRALARDLATLADADASGRDSLMELFAAHQRVVSDSIDQLLPTLERAIAALRACLGSGHKVLACGNGGSAADAQHFVAELVGRFRNDGPGLAALSLTADTATCTSIANDLGYEHVFARQVEALAQPGDVLLAISTSGNSPNILAAAAAARRRGCFVIAMTGRGGGSLLPHADVALRVPSDTVARIQEVHGILIHALAESLDSLRLPLQP